MRVSCVFRGGKRRSFGGATLATRYLARWTKRSGLGTLTALEPKADFGVHGKNLYALMYVNEVLLRVLSQDDDVPGLFRLYEGVLNDLSKSGDSSVIALRQFEKHLLDLIGYGLRFEEAPHGQELSVDQQYQFDAGLGFVRADEDSGYAGSTLLAIEAGDYSLKTTRQDARKLLQSALNTHIDVSNIRARELLSVPQADS